ncbi:MAG: 4Fe-4S binding protein [Mariprofundaceae bacterium]|nr:4Fe-4S binding protein [Mariprofundaceae bacterium]
MMNFHAIAAAGKALPSRVKRSQYLHILRRASQLAFMALIILAPVLGLFRIDILAGAFVIGSYQVWFADFAIVFGAWFLMAGVLVLSYSWLGAVFCGWACPQGLLSELGSGWMHRLLGRRAGLSVDGSGVAVALRKKKWVNWALLGLAFVAASMLFALIPILYFYPPLTVWHFLTLQSDAAMPLSMYWIYFVFCVVMLLDIGFIRHIMCQNFCVYRIWQHSFKTSETMRIGYDAVRSDECVKCEYCASACAVDLDPKHTEVYSGCTACGECIVACDRLHEGKGKAGLLSFVFPSRQESPEHMASMSGRFRGVLPFLLVGALLLVFGIKTYSPYEVSVGNIGARNTGLNDYVVHLSNKRYRASGVSITVKGLKADQYHLDKASVHFNSAGMVNIGLHLNAKVIRHGMHRFIVHLESNDGWHEDFPVQYYRVGDVT